MPSCHLCAVCITALRCANTFNLVRTETVYIPEVGKVAAGQPILAIENIDAYLPFPAYMIPQGKDVFVLTVKGDSMVDAGIFDGDKLVVAKQNTAQNGEIVVALVDDSATVKTFYKEDGHYRLQPQNSSMEPIIVDNVEIIGKVISLFRPKIVS